MSRVFVRAVAFTATLGGLALGAAGCGSAEDESTPREVLGVAPSALSVTQSNLTAGQCTATVELNRSGTSLVGVASDSCKRDSTIMGRFYLERLDDAGAWQSVGFASTGHRARTGGSVTATAANQPPGTYRARYWFIHSDTKQVDTTAEVSTPPATY